MSHNAVYSAHFHCSFCPASLAHGSIYVSVLLVPANVSGDCHVIWILFSSPPTEAWHMCMAGTPVHCYLLPAHEQLVLTMPLLTVCSSLRYSWRFSEDSRGLGYSGTDAVLTEFTGSSGQHAFSQRNLFLPSSCLVCVSRCWAFSAVALSIFSNNLWGCRIPFVTYSDILIPDYIYSSGHKSSNSSYKVQIQSLEILAIWWTETRQC